ncbi:universal stress protein [Patulibacter sp. SYSU D01012]|uniref:universal stress protein n=1 Tax=Patulibacter sp. SYSU D01012 TaxID=2817381 RepID=UPI001B3162E5|nr:universal stress protein [Patulibacter sp. SYSU D01012]
MFTTILVGFDGTPEALGALDLARRLGADDTTLIVADVLTDARAAARALVPGGHPDDLAAADLAPAREMLDDRPWVEYAAPRARSVAEGLHRTASETMSDLIVVGATRHGAAARRVLGDDAEATLHGAPCAVAVAPAGATEEVRHVGVAFDGTAAGRRAVAVAAALAAEHHADLTLLSVVDTTRAYATFGTAGGFGDVRREAREALTDAAAGVHGVPRVRRRLLEGDPVREAVALSHEVDLLVLGARANGPALRLLLGSVSSRVVRRAECPVMVVPEAVRVADGAVSGT